jgi:hypothetical protein
VRLSPADIATPDVGRGACVTLEYVRHRVFIIPTLLATTVQAQRLKNCLIQHNHPPCEERGGLLICLNSVVSGGFFHRWASILHWIVSAGLLVKVCFHVALDSSVDVVGNGECKGLVIMNSHGGDVVSI